MKDPTQQSEQMMTSPDQRPLIISSKLTLALIITLCGWLAFGLSSERKVILPDHLDFSLYLASGRGNPKTELPVIEIDGYDFYQEPIRLSLADKERLVAMLEDRNLYYTPRQYTMYRPIKKCGGFNANYALVWEDNRLLICFGCGEVRHYQGDDLDEYDLVFMYRVTLMNFLGKLSVKETVQDNCLESDGCKDDGRCTALNGRCVIASDQDCIHLCKQSGRCSANLTWGACMINRNQHCQQSITCQENGRCARAMGDRDYFLCKQDQPISEILMREYFEFFLRKRSALL